MDRARIEGRGRTRTMSLVFSLGAGAGGSRVWFNLGVASGEQANASDLMAHDATEGSLSVSQQTLVVREEGKAPTHFVSGLLF
jgi:hypothetical protein